MSFTFIGAPRGNAGRFRRGALAGAGAGVVASALLMAGAPAMAGTVPAAVPATALATMSATVPAGTATALAPTVTTVTLPTGDHVAVTTSPGGQSSYAMAPVAGGGQAFQSYQGANGDHYVVPAIAMPYLNRGLDPSLFDVTALARDAAADGGRIPVDLSFAAGVTPTAPAGVTVTSVSGSQEQGYLTSGTAFAAALRAQIGADVAAGRQPGTTALFGGLSSMSLGGGAVTPGLPVQPDYALSILQINVTDLTGQPSTGAFVALYNTDSFSRELTSVPVVDGIARVAVPAGDYGIYSGFDDFDAQGQVTATRQVTLGDFTVAATGVTTVSLNESSATSLVSVATPRPSTRDALAVNYIRQDATGAAFNLLSLAFGSLPQYVSPQAGVRVGALHYLVQWGGEAPSASDGYRYDFASGSDDVPADESFVMKPGQYATVNERFSSDPAASTQYPGALLNGAVDASNANGGVFAIGSLNGVLVPGNLTDYLGTGDGGGWAQDASYPSGLEELGDSQYYAGGHTYTVDWGHGPLAPGFGQHTGYQYCQACTAGTSLSLVFNPFDDSDPSHAGISFLPGPSDFTLYQNGNEIFTSAVQDGVVLQGIPATPATYRAVFDASLGGGLSQSTQTHTDLTVRYTPQAAAGSALPNSDSCYGQAASTPCEVLPVLNLDYNLVSNEDNTSSAPIQRMDLTVGHVSYDGAGSHARITSAAVSVSFDGGTTWTQATVAGADGNYVVLWSNPASARGTDPEIKVSATDGAGGSITQTITNAYTIAKSSN